VVYDLPAYVWLLEFAGVVGIPAVTCVALYRGALAAGLARRTAGMVAGAAGVGWGVWVLASGLLAYRGAYQQEPTQVRPWIGVALVAATVAVLLATRIPVVARILADPGTPARLALAQAPRVVGAVFLIVLALGDLPAVFAVPAGVGDIAVGLAAPFVARRLTRPDGRTAGMWFNILGLLDLIVAVSLGFLAGLGPTRLISVTPSTAAIGLLPLVLIPTTAVALAAALHIVSLRRLWAAARPAPAAGDLPRWPAVYPVDVQT
jgi:hypothetical protein